MRYIRGAMLLDALNPPAWSTGGAWDHVLGRVDENLPRLGDGYPLMTVGGAWQTCQRDDWVEGYWPGLIWLAYAATGEDRYLLAARAAVSSLDDSDHVRWTVQRNANERQEFFNQANARMLRTIDSQANSVMLNTTRPGGEIVEHFKANRILVAGPYPRYDTYIRVSLGTSDEIREFWRVWDLLPSHHMSMK